MASAVSEIWRLLQGSAVEAMFRNFLAHSIPNIFWPLDTVFAGDGACSLGFGTVKAAILVTVVILAACVEQVYFRNVENWLLNEVWLGRSVHDVMVVSFAEGPFH